MPRKKKDPKREARRQRELSIVNESTIDNQDRLCPHCGLALILQQETIQYQWYRNYTCALDGCRNIR